MSIGSLIYRFGVYSVLPMAFVQLLVFLFDANKAMPLGALILGGASYYACMQFYVANDRTLDGKELAKFAAGAFFIIWSMLIYMLWWRFRREGIAFVHWTYQLQLSGLALFLLLPVLLGLVLAKRDFHKKHC